MLDKVLKIFYSRPKSGLVFLMLICCFFSYFALFLEVDASSESLLLENDKDLLKYEKSLKTFPQDDFLLVAYESKKDDIFSDENILKLKTIQNDLEKIDGIKSILSILNAPLFKNEKENILSGADIQNAKKEILDNDFYVKNIISKDAKIGSFVLFLDSSKNETLKQLKFDLKQNPDDKNLQKKYENAKKDAKDYLDSTLLGLKSLEKKHNLIIGGLDMIAYDMIFFIKNDLLIYGISLVILLSLALFWFFRRPSFVFLSIFICIISLLCTSGILVLLGYKVTVISSNYVALVLIITLSVLVHLLSHFVEVNNKFPNRTNVQKIRLTLLFKANPSFFAILTTVIGFLSLIFSGIKPIEDLGVMMSIGISVSLVLCYVFFACFFPLLSPLKTQNLANNKSFLSFCSNVAINHHKKVYFISVVAVILTILGIQKLKVENSFVNYFKDSSSIKKGLVLIDENLGGTIPLDIILTFNEKNETSKNSQTKSLKNDENDDEFDDLFDEYDKEDEKYFLTIQKLEVIKKVHLFLEQNDYIGSVLSTYSVANFAKNITPNLDNFTLAYMQNNLGELGQSVIEPYLNADKKQVRFSLRIKDSDKQLRRGEFLQKLNDDLSKLLKNENVDFQISGIMLLYNNMLQSLLHSQVDTLAFVILSIFGLFLVIFRNIRFSIIGIIANVVPLGLVFALIGFSGIPLDLMSITIAAICIGIGVDDIIHYVHKFRIEIRTKSLNDAIISSHQSIGSALFYTTFTVVLGFGVMVSSNFIPTIYFGLLTIFVMILLLCGSLFLLPSLIISLHFKGYFKQEKNAKKLKNG